MVTDLWHVLAQIDTSRLHSFCWHSTTVGRIATRIIALTLLVTPLSDKNFVNFGPVTSDILWLVCREWVGAHR